MQASFSPRHEFAHMQTASDSRSDLKKTKCRYLIICIVAYVILSSDSDSVYCIHSRTAQCPKAHRHLWPRRLVTEICTNYLILTQSTVSIPEQIICAKFLSPDGGGLNGDVPLDIALSSSSWDIYRAPITTRTSAQCSKTNFKKTATMKISVKYV